jgi:7-cyano-7-deazaguanine synthase
MLDGSAGFGSIAAMTAPSSALVLFSGGQDSSICLAHALEHYHHVETVAFTYGQRHAVELACRLEVRDALAQFSPAWAERLGQDHILSADALAEIGGSSLTDQSAIQMREDGLPSSFVPGRNLIFFTYAAALGYRRGISTLVGGMCETDFSGYPDCRAETLRALNTSINLGMNNVFTFETPLMHLSKAQSWQMAADLGGQPLVELILEHSHSCYEGVRASRHDWGYGCGTCPACVLRAKGYDEWRTA